MFPIEEDRRYLPDHVPVSVCIVQPGILEHLPVQGRGRTVSEPPIAVPDVAGGRTRFPDPDQSPEYGIKKSRSYISTGIPLDGVYGSDLEPEIQSSTHYSRKQDINK